MTVPLKERRQKNAHAQHTAGLMRACYELSLPKNRSRMRAVSRQYMKHERCEMRIIDLLYGAVQFTRSLEHKMTHTQQSKTVLNQQSQQKRLRKMHNFHN